MAHTFLSHLKERDLVSQISHEEELSALLQKGVMDEKGKRYGVYAGFDPTAKSLHVGHLVIVLALRRAQDFGLTPIIVFGGATALIGDPTGRTDMRPMLTRDEINESVDNFKKLIGHYFREDVPNKPVYVNNIDWLGDMSWLDFARNVGVHFTVARLLSSEFGKTRLENGLTFMELSYQLMQAYDFLHLSREHNCILQIGGNDQWSNVLAGADLIRRVEARKAFALTLPLLAGKDGRKYGKTAGNAIWIDRTLLPPYEFFQFCRNIADADIELFMRVFLNTPLAEIQKATDVATANINETKERLAYEMTALVHDKEAAGEALKAARALFAGGGLDLSAVPSTDFSADDAAKGIAVLDLLVKCGVSPSKSEARRLIQGNGLHINNEKVSDVNLVVSEGMFKTEFGGVLLRKGKKDYHLAKLS